MRYLGNKTSIVQHIVDKLEAHHLLERNDLRFFDAFCGTGTVAYAVRNYFPITLNDNLLFPTIYSQGRIVADTCTFQQLGFNPIDYFNNNQNTHEGYVYHNYAPTAGNRMYFSDENAKRIDYFRQTIEDWYNANQINYNEYCYLLCCLLESISKVANVAGVYGAFLKTWDGRALKPIQFIEPETNRENLGFIHEVEHYNGNIEDIISNIDCDILYLDPPYTHNSYSVQYHLLETIIQNDNPQIKGVTGARPYTNISNKWSRKNEVEVAFDNIIAKTNARYILFSYSSDGIMSEDYIQLVLKRYCYADSIEVEHIPYKEYKNFKTTDKANSHYEYLFYAEKKPNNEVEYYCPLNYMGGKSNIISHIKPHLTGKSKFLDVMGGGFNVGINTTGFNTIRHNDINFIVSELLQMFFNMPTSQLLTQISRIIHRYGLASEAKEPYLRLRDDYNQRLRNTPNGNIYLFTLICFGFQQQIRFNSQYEFNNPIGMSGYNDSIKEKIVSFSRRLKEMCPTFSIMDFAATLPSVDADTLVYIDPPYLITLGSYNDGKRGFNGWNKEDEIRLLQYIDECHDKGAKVVLSNILDYKGLENTLLKDWITNHQVETHNIVVRGRNEILVIYE